MSNQYDLAILGAGPAGYVAAIRASQLGMKCVLVERRSSLGGTCMNIGCIPSKALLHSSELFAEIKHGAKDHGITAENIQIDVKKMQKHKQGVVQKLGDGIQFLMKQNGVTVLTGTGTIKDSNRVEVLQDAGTKTIKAERILLATGSVPQEIPGIEFDGKYIVTSTEALEFQSAPKRLLVVGGGAIGLEIGSVWSRLGSEVIVIEGTKDILPGWDAQIARLARKELASQGMKFVLNAKVASVQRKGKKVAVSLAEGGEDIPEGDKVLIAVGRRPALEFLDLSDLRFEYEENKRHLKVNENYQTNIDSIYAVGDIIKGPMLAHKASEEGIVAVERMHGIAARVNYDVIPGVVYTSPEIASVGLSEEALKAKGIAYKKGEAKFTANGRALATDAAKGSAKILADAATDTILGVHIVGPHASELAGKAVTAMEFRASSEDIARIIYAHPTLSETVKEAALGVSGHKIHSG